LPDLSDTAIKDFMQRQKYGQNAQNDAAELKLRAEQRLGELLADRKIETAFGDEFVPVCDDLGRTTARNF
jgi:hypothetical protein